MLSPKERALAYSAGALASWSRTKDPAARTAPARAKFDQRFVREVDPDGTLDPAELERRVKLARRAYFRRLAIKSSQARRAKAGGARG